MNLYARVVKNNFPEMALIFVPGVENRYFNTIQPYGTRAEWSFYSVEHTSCLHGY
ncbi:MAG: hypothetical protein PF503_18315 [Desulfobacula sp.]|jgi:hypothetical protein|nr:hypothetical protein [Desulfobacula sp.]